MFFKSNRKYKVFILNIYIGIEKIITFENIPKKSKKNHLYYVIKLYKKYIMKKLLTPLFFVLFSLSLTAQQSSLKFMFLDSRSSFESYKSFGGGISFNYPICDHFSAEMTVGLTHANAPFASRYASIDRHIDILQKNRELNIFTDLMGKYSVLNIKNKHRLNIGVGPSFLYAKSEFMVANGSFNSLEISNHEATAYVPMLGMMIEYDWKISKSIGIFTRYNYRTSFGETARQKTNLTKFGNTHNTSGIKDNFNFALGLSVFL